MFLFWGVVACTCTSAPRWLPIFASGSIFCWRYCAFPTFAAFTLIVAFAFFEYIAAVNFVLGRL